MDVRPVRSTDWTEVEAFYKGLPSVAAKQRFLQETPAAKRVSVETLVGIKNSKIVFINRSTEPYSPLDKNMLCRLRPSPDAYGQRLGRHTGTLRAGTPT